MPFNALYTSSTGLQAADFFLDITGNNIANSSTVGYQTARVTFEDLVYQAVAEANQGPVASQDGRGVVTQAVTTTFTQGPTQPTGNALDVAIQGDGFLVVTRPDGTNAFTRAGNLSVDAAGNLVTSDGLLVQPPVVVPPGSANVAIGTDGRVTATTPDGQAVEVGRVGLARFANPSGLLRVGDTLFAETGGSGPATGGFPGNPGFGAFQTGALEGANVDLTTELVTLILAQQTFRVNGQSLSVDNAVVQSTLDLIAIG